MTFSQFVFEQARDLQAQEASGITSEYGLKLVLLETAFTDSSEHLGLRQQRIVRPPEDSICPNQARSYGEYIKAVKIARSGCVIVDVPEMLAYFGHQAVEGQPATPVREDQLEVRKVLCELEKLPGERLTLTGI
jgi:hypothetical protein